MSVSVPAQAVFTCKANKTQNHCFKLWSCQNEPVVHSPEKVQTWDTIPNIFTHDEWCLWRPDHTHRNVVLSSWTHEKRCLGECPKPYWQSNLTTNMDWVHKLQYTRRGQGQSSTVWKVCIKWNAAEIDKSERQLTNSYTYKLKPSLELI